MQKPRFIASKRRARLKNGRTLISQRRRSKALWFAPSILATLVLICVFVGRARKKHTMLNVEKVRTTLDWHHKSKARGIDTWWMTNTPPLSMESFQMFQNKKDRVLQLLSIYKDLSPESKKIADRIDSLRMSIFLNGIKQEITIVRVTNSYPSNTISICFLPEKTAREQKFLIPAFHLDLDALIIPAINIPEKLYTAILFHEFGHAVRHNTFDGFPEDTEGSDDYILEEISMHEFGGRILNAASNGAYDKLIGAILSRGPSLKRFDDAIALLNLEDCRAFDLMFECGNTDLPSNMLITQCALDIGFHFCDAHLLLEPKYKIKVYQWFQDYIFARLPK